MNISLWIMAEEGDDQEELIVYIQKIRSFLEQPFSTSQQTPAHHLTAHISEIYAHKPSRYKIEYKVNPDFVSKLLLKSKTTHQT